MGTLELKVYDIFKSGFSEQEATTVIEYVEEKIKEKVDDRFSKQNSKINQSLSAINPDFAIDS